jgi:hypothetical protein
MAPWRHGAVPEQNDGPQSADAGVGGWSKSREKNVNPLREPLHAYSGY